jgi:hypothetical protein
MFKHLAVVAAGLAAIALPATQAEALTPADQPTCGSIISVDTVLTQDLHCDQAFPFLQINDGVTLDLNGHRLSGDAAGGMPQAIIVGNIKNGTLKDVAFEEVGGTLDKLNVRGGAIRVDRNATLSHSSVRDSNVFVTGTDAQVVHDMIRGGGGVIIDDIDHGIQNFLIGFNDISHSTGPGVTYCIPIFFEANDVTGSVAFNVIENNTGPGVQFCNAVQNLGQTNVAFNVISHNGGDGISVSGQPGPDPTVVGGPVRIGANILVHNVGAGVEATWVPGLPSGIVDLGSDFGFFNGAPCLGVICTPDIVSPPQP